MRSPLPIPEVARREFSYDPTTGALHRIEICGRLLYAPLLVTHRRAGYLSARIHGHTYLAHRIAWFLGTGENPVGQIDHINGDRLDNRLCNLRLATASQNTCNRPKFKANGFPKGVRSAYGGKFTASIAVERNTYHLGTFDSCEVAAAAYQFAAVRMHGAFARTD